MSAIYLYCDGIFSTIRSNLNTIKDIMMKFILSTLILFNTSFALAEECEIVISGSDMMKYDTSEINIDKKCDKIIVTLKHSGNLPVNVMGHNILFLETKNLQMITSKVNMSHGIENGFIPELSEVLLKSEMIGGGQETTFEIDPKVFKSGVEYMFICSFPGHYALMKGKLNI